MHDVLIIGAGAAGLIAAKTLHTAGFDVAVCEGRDRIGGRIRTERRGGKTIELGAEFIHGKPQSTLALAREAGIELVESCDLRLLREKFISTIGVLIRSAAEPTAIRVSVASRQRARLALPSITRCSSRVGNP
jgi:monoamine oxidase